MPDAKPKPVAKTVMVRLALNPSGGVDVLGEIENPILCAGEVREFTPVEADALLALTNEHGTPIVSRLRSAE